jgi:hypothetical protein
VEGPTTSSSPAPLVNTEITSTASCPAGETLFGGGYTLSGSLLNLNAVVTESRPVGTTTWTATARNYATGVGSFSVKAYVVCSV